MCQHIMKVALFSLGLMPSLFYASLVQAQSSSGLSNSIQNSGSMPPTRLDNIQPVRQPNFLIDSSSGSQQFFRDGRDSLYLLPAESAEPILKIDEGNDIQETEQIERNDIDGEKQLNNE